MNFYITKEPTTGAFGGCVANFVPANTVAIAPMDGADFPNFNDLDISTVGGVTTATINPAKKAARLAAEAAKAAADQTKDSTRSALAASITAFKAGDIKTVADAEAILLKIAKLVAG